MMLQDLAANGLEFDAAADVATLILATLAHGAPATARSVRAKLLLDAAGYLVGVDLEGVYATRRLVAMLGPHEAVASVREAQVELVERDGEPTAIRISDATRAIRGAEKSPYRG